MLISNPKVYQIFVDILKPIINILNDERVLLSNTKVYQRFVDIQKPIIKIPNDERLLFAKPKSVPKNCNLY